MSTNPQRVFVPLSEMSKRHPIKESTFRYWVFNAESNGLNVCLSRVGGRVFVDEDAFLLWLDGFKNLPPCKQTGARRGRKRQSK